MKNNNHIIIIKGNHNWFYAKVITNKNMWNYVIISKCLDNIKILCYSIYELRVVN
jgi:hypothetical protein